MNGREPVAPVRVAHFTDTYLPRRDGIVTALRTTIPELRAAGHPGLLVAPHHPAQPAGEVGLALASLPTGVADLRLSLPRIRYVTRVAQWSPALVHVHTIGTTGLLGTLAARELSLPVVVTYHTDLHAYADAYRIPTCVLRMALRFCTSRLAVRGLRPRCRSEVIDAFNTLLFQAADTVIVPTEAILRRAPFRTDHPRIVVVPTGVAFTGPSAGAGREFRARWSIPQRAPVVLFVGRVNREKGIELLAHAFRVVLDAVPDARLVLVGAVYRPRWLRAVLSRAGVAGRTVITGQQPTPVVRSAYAAAQVFGFPSLTDTQGLVLYEAALAGVPSVLIDPDLHATSPLREGLLLSRPAPAAMGSALATLLVNLAQARHLGAIARQRAAEIDPRRHSERLLTLYRDVLSRYVP
jgi:glycosyltransferase involved in cell wall biosynthesis